MISTKVIKSTFSMFGNFSKLNGREADLRRIFEGYQGQVQQETLPNGVPAKVYRFMKENTGVTVRAFRIDFEFGYTNDEITSADFISYVAEVSKLLSSLDTIKGNRIAYNSVEFVPNDDNKLIQRCNEIFNIGNVFGSDAKEFNLRVNHVKNINGEDFNSILIIQDGAVTHNVTKEKINALFLNKDINSLIGNATVRFNLENAADYTSDLILESNDRANVFLKNIM